MMPAGTLFWPNLSVPTKQQFSLLALLLLMGASSSAYSQQSVYPKVATDDCSKTTNPTGQIWYVGTSGSDWTTYNNVLMNGNTPSKPLHDIQFAVGIASPGDMVCVMAGTYSAFNVNVSGLANKWIKVEAMPGAQVTINTAGGWGIYVSGNYVQISGFTIIGGSYGLDYWTGMSYKDDPGSHADYNGNCISVIAANGSHPHHVNILNNIIGACPGGGIGTVGADYVTISGNTVYDSSWYSAYGTSGISMLNDYDTNKGDTSTNYKMIVTDNKVYNNMEFIPWVVADKISDGEGIIVDSNDNHNFDTAVPYPAYTGRTLIANNTVTGNGGPGILVFQSAHVDVLNNSTYRNLVSGTFQNAPLAGGEFVVYGASDVRALNNIFYAVGNSSPLVSHDACINCYIDYNLYYGGQSNQWPNGAAYNDSHSRFANPGYVKLSNTSAEVNLAISSYYTNALQFGTGWLAPTSDITGKARVVSGQYTTAVGAFAYP